jgi:TPR repeat protein
MTHDEIVRLAYDSIQREDFEAAKQILRPLAENESIFALETLGWIHCCGPAGQLNFEIAKSYLQKAISCGSVQAYLHLGWGFINEGDFSQARIVFEKGKALGGDGFDGALSSLQNVERQHAELLEASVRRAFESKEYDKAFALLHKNKAKNSEFALLALGWLYQSGLGCAMDKPAALSLYRRAAQIGSVESHYFIGILELELGNAEKARRALLHGAEKEHWPSMSKLGSMMIEGEGGPIDIKEGLKLLETCAHHGHIMSKIRLLRHETTATDSILKRIFLQMKCIWLLLNAAQEVSNDPYSQKFFELVP